MNARWLVTGASGQLGSRVVAQLLRRNDHPEILGLTGRHELVAPGARTAHVNLADFERLEQSALEFRPEFIVHSGAMTAVAEAFANRDLAMRVNAGATAVLASAAQMLGARLILISTDMVFDGTAAPYSETDTPKPASHYGLTKLDGERALGEVERGLVVRLPLMYGFIAGQMPPAVRERVRPMNGESAWNSANAPTGLKNADGPDEMQVTVRPMRETTFSRQIDALLRGAPLELFSDEFRTPIWVEDAAAAVIGLAGSDHRGIMHVAGPRRLSRYEMMAQCARILGIDEPRLSPISRLSIETPEPRPADLSLSCELFSRLFPNLSPGPIRARVFTQ